jgi:quinol-cytochrome oxidoreductase complex cytochrome b subunit
LFSDFLEHIFPRLILEKNLRITYTFCLGGLAFTAFMLLVVSGLLLLFYYQPCPEKAFESILFLESSVPGGRFVRSLHRLTSHALLVLIFLHTLRVILTGAYRKPREFNWVIGFFILCSAVFGAYTGYLLPMDQLGFWGTHTGMELIRTAPFGEIIEGFLVPDEVGGPVSLLRFYTLHIAVIPLTIAILCFLHFYRIRHDKGVLPYL